MFTFLCVFVMSRSRMGKGEEGARKDEEEPCHGKGETGDTHK